MSPAISPAGLIADMGEVLLRPWVQAVIDHQLFLVVGLIALELAWSAWRRRPTHTVRITLSSVSLALLHFGAYVITTFLLVLPVLQTVREAFGVFDLPVDGALAWGLCLLGTDLCAYCLHRSQHHVRWFWVGHSVHHTAPEFNLTVGPRLGLLDTLDRIPFFLPLALLGFHAEMIVLCYALIELWSFWTHTSWVPRLRWLPWFEWVFNTPANHRLHHGRNAVYLDRNFGEFTMLWDHLFGTYVRQTEPVDYGATLMPPRQDPWTANVFELRRLWADVRAAPNWRVALAVPWRSV